MTPIKALLPVPLKHLVWSSGTEQVPSQILKHRGVLGCKSLEDSRPTIPNTSPTRDRTSASVGLIQFKSIILPDQVPGALALFSVFSLLHPSGIRLLVLICLKGSDPLVP